VPARSRRFAAAAFRPRSRTAWMATSAPANLSAGATYPTAELSLIVL